MKYDIAYFLCFIDSFSPSVSHGKRFLYCVFTFITGKQSSYIFLNIFRNFEKYVWHCWYDSRMDQSVFLIFSIYLCVRDEFIIRTILCSSLWFDYCVNCLTVRSRKSLKVWGRWFVYKLPWKLLGVSAALLRNRLSCFYAIGTF